MTSFKEGDDALFKVDVTYRMLEMRQGANDDAQDEIRIVKGTKAKVSFVGDGITSKLFAVVLLPINRGNPYKEWYVDPTWLELSGRDSNLQPTD